MTRRDWKILAWLLPLATALALWLLVRANSCIVDRVVIRWREWFPPSTDITQSPYGLLVCDHWPRWYDHAINIALLVIIAAVVGRLSRRFERRAAAWAAAIMAGALGLTFLFSWWVYQPRDDWDAFEFAATAGVMAFAAGIAALTARVTAQRRRDA